MTIRTTSPAVPENSNEDATAPTAVAEQAAPSPDPGVAVLPPQAEALLPEASPVDGQVRVLRLREADGGVVVETDGEFLQDLALADDMVVIQAAPPVPWLELVDPESLEAPTSAAAAHSQAALQPLSEPGEVIELLSGSQALSGMEGLVPFGLPSDLQGDSFVFLAGHGASGQGLAYKAVPGGPGNDLLFLDFTPFAKPENPGNGNGGGKGGGGKDDGGGDPNAVAEYLSGTADPSDDGFEYNILVDFKGSWSVDLQDAFIWAADWTSSVITDDVPDVFYRGKIVDDILITAELKDIDGPGGVLGQAGPTAVRTDGYLPAVGKMEFDTADAEYFDSIGNWEAIVIHEMLHTIGFGTVWDFLGLVDGSGTDNPTFNGVEAVLAYADLFGGSGAVPLESGYGPGTDDSHWDEALFGNEIMTGFLNSDHDAGTVGDNYMSGMTVASLNDLGYATVSWSEFAEFTV